MKNKIKTNIIRNGNYILKHPVKSSIGMAIVGVGLGVAISECRSYINKKKENTTKNK